MPNFRLICFFFWQRYSPKTVSVDDVIFFFKLRFGAFLDIAPTKNGIFSILRPNQFINTYFFRRYQCENLILYDPGLTWPFYVADFQWVILQNGFDLWILLAKLTTKHVPLPDFFLILWPFVTFSDKTLTRPVLSMTLMLTGYLQ